jgi:hypothetical protein
LLPQGELIEKESWMLATFLVEICNNFEYNTKPSEGDMVLVQLNPFKHINSIRNDTEFRVS